VNDANVLAELRAWREEFARTHGYDLGAMGAALRELDRAAGERVVGGSPRSPAIEVPSPPAPIALSSTAGRASAS
jgi:hypothetical protein